ncbi:hypothetical protein BGZ54_009907 [Gamsiella multidivaricata]|nr:hypothetical protein BGZ54_009907 [Gamsiella multidivaricata]
MSPRFNGFHNFSNNKDERLSHSESLERLLHITEVDFPAVSAKSRATQKRMIERFNRTVLHNEFPDGAKVMTLDPILGDKLTPKYEGPNVVVRRTTGGAYVLKGGAGDLLQRQYAPSQLKLVPDDCGDTTYKVEEILEHRDDSEGGMEYIS